MFDSLVGHQQQAIISVGT